MMYPLVLDLQRSGIAVAKTCRVLGFSKQAFYKWRANPITDREWSDAHLINSAIDIHEDDPGFGYRFICDELKAAGVPTSENRVARLCSQQKMFSIFTKRKGPSRQPGPPLHDDVVKRRFFATRPDALWLTDITEHKTGEGKLYLCAVKDMFSNRIVGWSIADNMKAALAETALRNAIAQREPAKTVVHSDRGSQFRSKKVVRLLANNDLYGSMGRVGACADNAAMESFFSLLQKNVLDTRRWRTRAELRRAIIIWIERTYNRRRRQRRLGKLTPVEFETVYNQAA